MRLIVCDSKTQSGRTGDIDAWEKIAREKGWTLAVVQNLKEVESAERPDLALLHVSEGWHALAYDHLKKLEPVPLFVAYSGAAPDRFEPWSVCRAIPYGSTKAVRANLDKVLAEWPEQPEQAWLFETISGLGPLEAALQILSALLPIGLLWETEETKEAQGTKESAKESAAKTLQSADRSNLPEFERLLQDYACTCIVDNGDTQAARTALSDKYRNWVERLGGANEVLERIEKLCKSETVADWNNKLAKLRDEWLGRANETRRAE